MMTKDDFSLNRINEKDSAELVRNLEELCGNVKESLRQAEERFYIAVNHMCAWEYWIGQNGHYIFVSPVSEKITGHKPDEFKDDQSLLLSITHPDDREKLIRHFKEEQESREIAPLDFRIINCHGEQRNIAHICHRVYDSIGRYMGIRATNLDVTDVKHAEAEKQEYEKRIQNYTRNIEHIGKLAMDSVNSFNNMVQKILGCVELMRLESKSLPACNIQKEIQKFEFEAASPLQQVQENNVCGQVLDKTGEIKEQLAEYDLNTHGKILLVDDEEFILNMATDMLKIVNFDVISACNGTEAIDIFKKYKDDITCIVLDLNLPDYDGKEIFEKLLEIKGDIPILISSGSNEHEVRLRFDNSPPITFLQKPYHFSTLVAKVNGLISKRSCAVV